MRIIRTLALALVVAALVHASNAYATDIHVFLLDIDVSNPGAVVISATGNAPIIDDNSDSAGAGVILDAFFVTASPFNGTPMTGNLSPAPGSVSYDSFTNNFGALTDFQLNLFAVFSGDQSFSTLAAAFSGAATLDLTGGDLPGVGVFGNILVGDTDAPGSGAVIGQWQVVAAPIPAPAALPAGIALLGVLGLRRRRRA